MSRFITVLVIAIAAAGCSSTAKRATITGVGAGAGAAVANAASDGNTAVTAGGALLGGVVAHVAQGRDETAYQQGVNDGYAQAVSDEAKRKYWQQQAVNARAGAGGADGRTVYYVFDESNKTTADGRKLAPETAIAVPVYEPMPVK